MRRILVTGGAGFIGSHTVDLLLAQNLEVVVFDNFTSGHLANLPCEHPALRVVQENILDYPALCTEVRNCDAILHLAAIPSVPKSIADPITSLQVNTQGFVHVLQAIRECQRPIRLVYASSAAVYADALELPCNDEHPLTAPVLSPYALDKANNERYAALYMQLFNIKSIGLRYFNVYGPRQDPHSPYSGVISKFIQCYQQQEPITIFGDGTQSRDFIAVSDVAQANWLALQSDYCGVLNIATSAPETIRNLVNYIETAGKTPATIKLMPARPGDITHSYATTAKANHHLSFRATIGLEQGIHSLLYSDPA